MLQPRTGFATVHAFPPSRIVRLPADALTPDAVTITHQGESRVYDSPAAFLADARESDPELARLRAEARGAAARAGELHAKVQAALERHAARAQILDDLWTLFLIAAGAGAAAAVVVFGAGL
jgi:hypothetical protein